MGKFYRGGFRKISSAEYGRYYGGKSRTDMAARITLAHACAKNSWLPARVGIGGAIIEAGGWSGVFLAVSKFLIDRHETAVQTFVDEMAVGWIGKCKCGMRMPLPVCGEWFVDCGVGDGILISRLKLLVTAVGINPNEVVVSSAADLGKLDVVVKKKPVVEKDDSPAPVLDSDQEAFVKSDARNARLLAPAGAGKTLTILHRCLELVNRQKTNKILLVTFTRAARDELKLRITTRKEFEDLEERVVVTTLNQCGFKLLKKKFASCRLISDKKDKMFVLGNQLRIVVSKSRSIAEKMENKRWTLRNSPKILEIIDAFKSLGMDHRKIKNADQFAVWCEEIINGELRELYYALIGRLISLKILPEREPLEIPPPKRYTIYLLSSIVRRVKFSWR